MKSYIAGSIALMLLFFQCSLNLPKQPVQPIQKKDNPLANLAVDQFIDPLFIEQFLIKLNLLKTSKGDSLVKIVHIGDSHIQMGYFTGEVRNTMQKRFGGTGIGIFFPNSLCSGFNPLGLAISSPSNWQCEKITNTESSIPLGIVGMAMKTEDSVSYINVSLKGKKELVKMFTIFHEKLDKTHEIKCNSGEITTTSFSEKSAMTTVILSEPRDTAIVEFVRKPGTKKPLVIYGLSVNNPADRGISYNTFGVSGGQYKFFSKNTPLLVEQMAAFKPDLMIISLGSNDSYDKTLTQEGFKNMLRDFIVRLRTASPRTEFILTTPPDTKYKNSKPVSGTIVNQSIIQIGKQANCTVWDFYSIMGGYSSFNRWKKEKLGNKDGLHLTSEGYYLQGQLFNLALAKAMEQKFPNNGWLQEAEEIVTHTLR